MHADLPRSVVVATLTVLLGVGTWMSSAEAQVPTSTSDAVVQDLVRQIHGLQEEVRYLRDRQEAVFDRLPVTDVSLHSEYDVLAGDVAARDQHGPWQTSSHGKKCGCYVCECPLPEAPCIDCPRVSTLNPYFNVHIFGALKLDMLFNSKRPISPGTPFFLLPRSITAGFDEKTFDMHARQSTVAAALTGPQFDGFQSGGLILATFYNDAIVVDQYGFLPLQAYGELRNEDWRFAAGLQFDVFNPGLPTVLPFSVLGASGNAGNAFRGQVRLERFLQQSDEVQWTMQVALSEPIASTIDPTFRISEDNGWPNVEGRLALGLGCIEGAGLDAKRPFELGISGVGGQIRTTIPMIPPTAQVVADVWGVGTDFRWRINDRFGVAAEWYTGQTLGTYNAAILQNVNTDTFEGIRSTGGWLELFTYLTPCLHSHFGYAIDDPLDRDIAVGGRLRNDTYFANLLWDLNATFRVGFEFTYRETAYRGLPDNEGAAFHTQFQWLF
jgi:hypothetical protein